MKTGRPAVARSDDATCVPSTRFMAKAGGVSPTLVPAGAADRGAVAVGTAAGASVDGDGVSAAAGAVVSVGTTTADVGSAVAGNGAVAASMGAAGTCVCGAAAGTSFSEASLAVAIAAEVGGAAVEPVVGLISVVGSSTCAAVTVATAAGGSAGVAGCSSDAQAREAATKPAVSKTAKGMRSIVVISGRRRQRRRRLSSSTGQLQVFLPLVLLPFYFHAGRHGVRVFRQVGEERHPLCGAAHHLAVID